MSWVVTHWEWLGLPTAVGVITMIRWLLCKLIVGKPKISINEHFTVGFKPSRSVWALQIMNRKISGWQRCFLCKRETLEDCRIEADFIIDGEPPKTAIWEAFTLKPNSYPYEIELISKIHGEEGFHIKRPDNDTLILTQNAKVTATLKSGIDTIKKCSWQITVLGKWSSDLDFKRLSDEL